MSEQLHKVLAQAAGGPRTPVDVDAIRLRSRRRRRRTPLVAASLLLVLALGATVLAGVRESGHEVVFDQDESDGHVIREDEGGQEPAPPGGEDPEHPESGDTHPGEDPDGPADPPPHAPSVKEVPLPSYDPADGLAAFDVLQFGFLRGDPELDGGCLWVEPVPGRRSAVLWPGPHYGRFSMDASGDARIELIGPDGGVVAQAGQRLHLGEQVTLEEAATPCGLRDDGSWSETVVIPAWVAAEDDVEAPFDRTFAQPAHPGTALPAGALSGATLQGRYQGPHLDGPGCLVLRAPPPEDPAGHSIGFTPVWPEGFQARFVRTDPGGPIDFYLLDPDGETVASSDTMLLVEGREDPSARPSWCGSAPRTWVVTAIHRMEDG